MRVMALALEFITLVGFGVRCSIGAGPCRFLKMDGCSWLEKRQSFREKRIMKSRVLLLC